MIKVAYSNVEKLDLTKAYPLLSNHRKNKVSRFRFDKDKKLGCGAYLLLMKLLEEKHIYNPLFKTGKYDKPYIVNYPNIHFNMSHSGKYVACAISDTQVGIDIEYNDPTIDLNIARNYFFNSEYENIIKSKNPSDEFFKYWVLKESYMKYTGLGFNLPLDSFEIIIEEDMRLKNDKNDIKFNLFDIKNYKLAVASHEKVDKCIEYKIELLY
ncbi:MAG: hypothetical protein BZ137_08615 [Methanosphaera sp. rholeuAM130]|nr:MAG: hypothetical protein BZ137_08615 [Methanosphaera sp. rholeuAM130]